MAIEFDGRKIRDQILADLKIKFAALSFKPTLAVIWVGNDPVSARYIEQKERAAEFIGVHFNVHKFSQNDEIELILEDISKLNSDPSVVGIMIQLPIPENLNRKKLISAISSEKDVDALRICSDLECSFRPPVTIGIMEALRESGIDLKNSSVAIIGRGFLVGEPLIKFLQSRVANLRVADDQTPHLPTITVDADIIVSATGHAGLIKPNMIKSGVVLIDAGTTELGGKLAGDIDPNCYSKSSFYTPVPGGIGPLTVAILYKNLFTAAQRKEK